MDGRGARMPDPRFPDLSVAVVDHSVHTRREVARVLEEEGFRVAGQAGSTEEGMKLSAASGANLFLVEVLMPKKSGLALLAAMLDGGYKGRVVMMSDLSTDNVVIEAIGAGANDFLRKPFGRADLVRCVEKAALSLARDGD